MTVYKNLPTHISSNWSYFPGDFWVKFLSKKLYPSLDKDEIPEDFVYEMVRYLRDADINSLKIRVENENIDAQKYLEAWQRPDDIYKHKLESIKKLEEKMSWLRSVQVGETSLDYLFFFHKKAISENVCLDTIEKWYQIIREDFSEDLASEYINDLNRFSEKYKIRYIFNETERGKIKIQYNPAVIAMEKVLGVKENKCLPLSVLQSRYSDFENNFGDIYNNPNNPTYLRNSISASANLLEAVANYANGSKNQTLGDILKNLPVEKFPHNALKQMFGNLYGFYSDYSGARHGNLNIGNRELTEEDVKILGIVSVLFADFLTQDEKN